MKYALSCKVNGKRNEEVVSTSGNYTQKNIHKLLKPLGRIISGKMERRLGVCNPR